MPKAKLKLKASDDMKKVSVAAYVSGVELGKKAVKLGNDLHVEVKFSAPNDLVTFGRTMETAKGDELDEQSEAPAKPTAKK